MRFSFNKNVGILVKISIKCLSEARIGSNNGLAPAKRHAIIWTNGGDFTDAYIRHSASMS